MNNNWWGYTDGSSCLMHHGVKGMKWGHRKKPQNDPFDMRDKKNRRNLRIGAGLTGSAIGAYKGSKYGLAGMGIGAAAGGATGYGAGAGYTLGAMAGHKLYDRLHTTKPKRSTQPRRATSTRSNNSSYNENFNRSLSYMPQSRFGTPTSYTTDNSGHITSFTYDDAALRRRRNRR